jgi:hypothetical protein
VTLGPQDAGLLPGVGGVDVDDGRSGPPPATTSDNQQRRLQLTDTTTLDQLTEDEARRLGATEAIWLLDYRYDTYAQDLGSMQRNIVGEAHGRFADRFGWGYHERYDVLQGAFRNAFAAAVSVAEQAAYESRPQGEQGVRDVLAWIREQERVAAERTIDLDDGTTGAP